MSSVWTEFSKGDHVWIVGMRPHDEEEDSGPKTDRFGNVIQKEEVHKEEPPKVPAVVASAPSSDSCTVIPSFGDICDKCARDPDHNHNPPSIELTEEKGLKLQLMAESNKEGRQNMVDLEDLQVGEMMYNLRIRYQEEPMQYYTYVGDILIVCNPLEDKGLTSQATREMYAHRPLGDPEVPPHIYGIGDEVYRKMVKDRRDQSIVISGESGAGKSESTKHVLQYIAFIAEKGEVELDVNSKILATSEVLEAFGNAKTTRNDNSSRFGKFVEIQFNNKNVIIGAEINQYLLEKSRIVTQEEGERGYHIFYCMFLQLKPAELAALHLTKVEDYRYLIGKEGVNIGTYMYDHHGDDIGDEERIATVMENMHILGFEEEFIQNLWRILAAVLNIGQLEFADMGNDSCEVSNVEVLNHVAELLEVDAAQLGEALVTYTVVNAKRNLTRGQAYDNANALAKALYGRLFEILVDDKINSIIGSPGPCARWIGVLDIFGFESFNTKLADGSIVTTNKFEQLCINLTNEVLQKYFYENQIPKQLMLYQKEHVDVTDIEYAKNDECVELVMGKKNSLFSLLDSVTKQASGNHEMMAHPEKADALWLQQIFDKYKKGRKKPLPRSAWRKDKPDYFSWFTKKVDRTYSRHEKYFAVHHYAEMVWYTIDGAIAKNKDTMYKDLNEVLQGSQMELIRQMVVEEGQGQKRARTIASKFAASLRDLYDKLSSTDPMFVRCVKTNCTMTKGGVFEDWKVLEQLVSAGMGAIVEMRNAGYPVQRKHEDFVRYFEDIVDDRGALRAMKPTDAIRFLCDKVLEIDPECGENRTNMAPYQVGLTMAFLKDEMFRGMSAVRDQALREKARKKKAAMEHLKALVLMWREQQHVEELKEQYERNKKRIELRRMLVAQGMTPEEADAEIARREEAERQRIKEEYRQKHFVPTENAAQAPLANVDAAVQAIDDFAKGSKKQAEKDDLSRRRKDILATQKDLTKALAEFAKNFYDKEQTAVLKATADKLVKKLDKMLRNEATQIVADQERRVAEIAEMKRLAKEETERRRREALEKLRAEKKAEAEAEQNAIKARLQQRQDARERKAAERKRKAEEMFRARQQQRAEEMRAREERLEQKKKEEKIKAKQARREANRAKRADARKEARTNALANLPVRFGKYQCIVRYVGSLPYEGSGTFVGIETPKPMGSRLGMDGSVLGTQLFSVPHPQRGMLVRPRMLEVLKPKHEFEVGDRVWKVGSNKVGTVKYVGQTSFATGVWVGVELESDASGRVRGKNDGSVKGIRYFICPPGTGIFVRPTKLRVTIPMTMELIDFMTQQYCLHKGIAEEDSDTDSDDEELRLRLREIEGQAKEIVINPDEIVFEEAKPEDFLDAV